MGGGWGNQHKDIGKRFLSTTGGTGAHGFTQCSERKKEVFAGGVGVSDREISEPVFRLSSEKGVWGFHCHSRNLLDKGHRLWAGMTCTGYQGSFH